MLYSNDKHCKSKVKENKINFRVLKRICKGCLGKWGECNGDLYDVGQGGAFLVEADVRGSGKDFVCD